MLAEAHAGMRSRFRSDPRCEVLGVSPVKARRPLQSNIRVHSVVTRCTLPLPLRAAFGAISLGYVMAAPGHFLLNRSFPVHQSKLTPAAPAALRCPWIGDEAAHARRLPAPEFERANTPRRQRRAKRRYAVHRMHVARHVRRPITTRPLNCPVEIKMPCRSKSQVASLQQFPLNPQIRP